MQTWLNSKTRIFHFQGSVIENCKDKWQMWEVGHSKEKILFWLLLLSCLFLDFSHKWPKPSAVICKSAHLGEINTGQWLRFCSLLSKWFFLWCSGSSIGTDLHALVQASRWSWNLFDVKTLTEFSCSSWLLLGLFLAVWGRRTPCARCHPSCPVTTAFSSKHRLLSKRGGYTLAVYSKRRLEKLLCFWKSCHCPQFHHLTADWHKTAKADWKQLCSPLKYFFNL